MARDLTRHSGRISNRSYKSLRGSEYDPFLLHLCAQRSHPSPLSLTPMAHWQPLFSGSHASEMLARNIYPPLLIIPCRKKYAKGTSGLLPHPSLSPSFLEEHTVSTFWIGGAPPLRTHWAALCLPPHLFPGLVSGCVCFLQVQLPLAGGTPRREWDMSMELRPFMSSSAVSVRPVYLTIPVRDHSFPGYLNLPHS